MGRFFSDTKLRFVRSGIEKRIRSEEESIRRVECQLRKQPIDVGIGQ